MNYDDYDEIINSSSRPLRNSRFFADNGHSQEIERLKEIIAEKDKEIEKNRIMSFLYDDEDDCSKQEKEIKKLKEIILQRDKHISLLQSILEKTAIMRGKKGEKIAILQTQLDDYIKRLRDTNNILVSSIDKMQVAINPPIP
jgi:hypothetical protein